MKRVFADTSYWIALFNPQDEWADDALRATRSLGDVQLITTQEVLTEFLNFFAAAGPEVRRQAAEAIREILTARDVTVLPQTPDSFLDGLELYEDDLSVTQTDCISRRAIGDEEIEEVLTLDRRFEGPGTRIIG